jgi:hypothetical protein
VALAKRAAAAGLAPSALSSHAMAHDHGQGLLLSFTNVRVEAAPAVVARLQGVVTSFAGLTVTPLPCEAVLSCDVADNAG